MKKTMIWRFYFPVSTDNKKKEIDLFETHDVFLMLGNPFDLQEKSWEQATSGSFASFCRGFWEKEIS